MQKFFYDLHYRTSEAELDIEEHKQHLTLNDGEVLLHRFLHNYLRDKVFIIDYPKNLTYSERLVAKKDAIRKLLDRRFKELSEKMKKAKLNEKMPKAKPSTFKNIGDADSEHTPDEIYQMIQNRTGLLKEHLFDPVPF